MFVKLVVLLSAALVAVDSARILSIPGAGSKSHRGLFDDLNVALAKRGHEVVVLTMFQSDKNITNLREVGPRWDISDLFDLDPLNEKMGTGIIEMLAKFTTFLESVPKILETPEVAELFEPGLHFDVILLNTMFNDISIGFAHRFKAPIIYMSTPASPMPWNRLVLGNIPNPAVEPSALTAGDDEISFMERVANTVANAAFVGARTYFWLPFLDTKAKKIFGDDIPPLTEIEREAASLVLYNSHFSNAHPVAYTPNVISVGGIHCKEAKPLPKELSEFADGSGDAGFIYFSLGSVVKTNNMSEEMRMSFVRAFAKLPQRVLWKWHSETMDGLPPNVKLGTWLPQQDILGHPKIRAFMTHGGLFSSTETLYHGVPLVGIPVFADQEKNVNDAVRKGYAVKLDLKDISEETVSRAIDEAINNKGFRANVKRLSTLFRDQETKPLDRAIYWVEYVIRHRGAAHLRTSGANLFWFQYHLLDVYTFLLSIIIVTIVISYYVIRTLFRCICCRNRTQKLKSS